MRDYRRVRATAWRLRLHDGVPDRPHVDRHARASHLRGYERDHEGTDRAVALVEMPSALDGLTVLDFSHALAGPYCTMLLAQYGARVYKIESPEGGDFGRSWGPPYTDGDAS